MKAIKKICFLTLLLYTYKTLKKKKTIIYTTLQSIAVVYHEKCIRIIINNILKLFYTYNILSLLTKRNTNSYRQNILVYFF